MKKIHNVLAQDNSGFSLIELIVSILIMSVITGMVVILISSSRNTYSIVKSEAELQGEAEVVKRFISNLAVEASECYAGKHNNDPFIYIVAPSNEESGKVTEHLVYFIYLQKDKNVLNYYNIKKTDFDNYLSIDGNTVDKLIADSISNGHLRDDRYGLLAEHVVDIVKKSADGSPLITIETSFVFNGSSYTTTLNLDGRNISKE